MFPVTATEPVNTDQCAGDKIEVLRSFKDGVMTISVPDGKIAVITAINFGASTATSISQHIGRCNEIYDGTQYQEECPFVLSQTRNPQPIRLAGTYKLKLDTPNDDALVDIKLIVKDCCTIKMKCSG